MTRRQWLVITGMLVVAHSGCTGGTDVDSREEMLETCRTVGVALDDRLDAPEPPGDEDALSCEGILFCAVGCDSLDLGCIQGCIDQGDPGAQEQADALLECALAHGCMEEMCLIDNCTTEIDACLNPELSCDPPCGPGETCQDGACVPDVPDCSCAGMLECAMGCADPFDPACHQACLAQCPPETAELVQPVLECALGHGCTDPDCLLAHCAAEIDACMSGVPPACDPPCGPGEICQDGVCVSVTPDCSCAGMLECALGCADPFDPACHQQCLSQCPPETEELVQPLLDCVEQNGCQDPMCVVNACSSQLETCTSGNAPGCDPPCDAGEVCQEGVCVPIEQGASCREITACALGCQPLDLDCYLLCIEQGTPEARQLANAVLDCAVQHACSDEACVVDQCNPEVQACLTSG